MFVLSDYYVCLAPEWPVRLLLYLLLKKQVNGGSIMIQDELRALYDQMLNQRFKARHQIRDLGIFHFRYICDF